MGHRGIWVTALGVAAAGAAAATALVVARDGSAAGAGIAPQLVMSELDHRYRGGAGYFVGGGVATFDCDADGFPDLFLAGGEAPAALYRNESEVGGELRFEPVPSPVTDLEQVTGAYPLDVDSDGVTDLMVLRHGGGNVLLRGRGGCAFDDATTILGLDGGDAWTVSFSATWEGGNALPTLAFGHYLRDDTHDCDGNVLVRPGGDRYGEPLPLDPGHCSLSMLFSDWDRSGRRDLRVSNDRNYYLDGSEQLWRIEPGVPPRLYTEADGWRKLQLWGMGIASRDLDGDGYPEVYLTSQGDNKLQQLDTPGSGGAAYRDIALDRGVTATQPFAGGDALPSTAWHPEFADVNNDGRADLLVAKGNVEAQPDYAAKDPTNLFLQQADGTFTEGAEAAGMVRFERTRGASVADLNLDGLLDVVLVHREAAVTVWRNVGSGTAESPGPMGHWLQVRLSQPAPNVDAVGAWIEVRTGERIQSIELTVGGGHASGRLGWTHVGLGSANAAEVRVRWPDGSTGDWMPVDADRFLLMERDQAAPTEWLPVG